MKKQVLSLALSATMLASMLPKPAFAADNTTFPDMPNDWSTQALQNAISNGLLNGIDGKIAASENLTRAQMAAIVTRAFGTNGKADISSFGDVNTGDWFYDAMASSVLMGAFQGDGVNLNPNANITRQEAFTVLARLFTLSGGDQSVLNSYTDGAQVADWAKDSMASMVAAGYVKGSDNKLNPLSSITRAEFAQVMDNLVKTYFADSQLNVNANGNAVLNKAGTLEGATISGDLIIGDGAAEGDVVLKDVTVSGRLLVRGGGTSTVTLEGNTTVGSVVVNKPTGAVRVENNTEKTVNVNAVSDNVVLTGDFNEVNANAAQGTVTLTGATVATMNVAGTSAKVVVSEKSTVETMNVAQSASGAAVSVQSGTTVKTMNTAASKAVVTVNGTVGTMSVSGSDTTVKAEEGAKIEKITTSAANTTVSGQGSVTNFEAAQGASGADITTSGTKVVNNGTGNVTTGNDKVIASGSTGTSESDNTGTTTPGGDGSTGGEDEGTPIRPVGGVGVANLADKDGTVTDIATNYSVNATQTVGQDYVNVAITASNVKYHTNANGTDGYWVGFSVVAPKGATKFRVGFANTQQGAEEALKVDVDGSVLMPNIDGTATDGEVGKQGVAVWASATADNPKVWVKLQWVNAKGENVDGATLYKMDLSNVTVAPIDNIDDLKSVLPENTYGEAYNISNVTLAGKVALSEALSVPTGKTLTVAKDSTLTVDETNKLTVAAGATVVVNGTVTGTIKGTSHTSKLVIGEGINYGELSAGEYVWDVDTSDWVKAPDTEGDKLPTANDWKFISSYTLTGEVTLEKGYEVPTGKTLVIAEDGFLDAYNFGLSGDGSVVVKGGTLKINANYNGGTGTDSKLPTIATIQVNHGGTLASMTTKVGEAAAADTKFVGPDEDARIQTEKDASVTFELGDFGKKDKPKMIISGNVTIPEGKTWYSMFDSGEDAIGISMTQESGTMTVDGILKIVSANKTGSSLTINENASVVVNGTMSVAAFGTVTNNGTIENNGTIDGSDKVEGADVTLKQSTLPVFPKFVDKGTEKVWINDGWFEYTEQKAELRGKGPGKEGKPEEYNYAKAYQDAGVTFENNVISVALATTKKFITGQAGDAAQLTQPSGELDPEGGVNGLFVGVQFAADKSLKAENGSVYVFRNGSNIGSSNAAFGLEADSVNGTGGDVLNNSFVNYLVFANASADAGSIGSNEWAYTFVWQNQEGNVVGVSQCTISRNIAE